VIQTVITIKVSSPYQLNTLIQALKALTVSARAERGMLGCKLYQPVGEETTVCFIEHWEATDDLEYQMRSNRYAQLLALMETAVEEPSMEFHTVSLTQGLDYLQAVRSGVKA
jgi:quinol monooxygenase YgiN